MRNNEIQKTDENSLTVTNPTDASALLALLHGKSESICKFSRKKIKVDKLQLDTLNEMLCEKLDNHDIFEISTSVDISLFNKKTITFKSWQDFSRSTMQNNNSAVRSIFMRWDFFIKIKNFANPQRHTVSIRISTAPTTTEVLHALFNGGLDDESQDLEMRCCTVFSKVDFVNNVLAEELLNLISDWTKGCEDLFLGRNTLVRFLVSNRWIISVFSESLFIVMSCVLCFGVVQMAGLDCFTEITNRIILFAIICAFFFCNVYWRLCGLVKNLTYNKLEQISKLHVFRLTKGDENLVKEIESQSSVIGVVLWLASEVIFPIGLNFLFKYLSL